MKEVIVLKGKKDGPVSVIMAGVHGNEPCGPNAFTSLLPTLKIDAGVVYFVIGNPNAIAENVRFTEFNLNRAFKPEGMMAAVERNSYEYHRAQFLKRYLDQASALLDIHSSFTPGSIPFVICERNGLEITKCLPASLVVHGFDAIHPGGTDGYMNQRGKIGICIECGHHEDPNAEKVAARAIRSFLNAREHEKTSTPMIQQQRHLQMDSLYRVKTNRFILAQPFKDFATVPRGVLIAIDGEDQVMAVRDSFVVFARESANVGDEGFCLGHELRVADKENGTNDENS